VSGRKKKLTKKTGSVLGNSKDTATNCAKKNAGEFDEHNGK